MPDDPFSYVRMLRGDPSYPKRPVFRRIMAVTRETPDPPSIAEVAAYKRAGSPHGTNAEGFARWQSERAPKPKPVPNDPRSAPPPQPIKKPE